MNLRPSAFLALAATVLLTALWLSPSAASGQSNERFRSWNQPAEPVQVIGNVYYVGANDIAAYLITTDDGHILIDGGFPETAAIIRDNVKTLGFELGDIRYILNTHAHFDHAGGIAELVRLTGAELIVSQADAPVFESGGGGDYLISAEDNAFPAVAVDRQVADGDTLQHGGVTLTANVTAGHTRGCTSWSLDVEENGAAHTVVVVCSLTLLPDASLIDNAEYPNIVEDFRSSFERLESIPCDIFLASHTRFFDIDSKRELLGKDGSNPFIDPEGYRAYIAKAKESFEKELAKQLAEQPSPPQLPSPAQR